MYASAQNELDTSSLAGSEQGMPCELGVSVMEVARFWGDHGNGTDVCLCIGTDLADGYRTCSKDDDVSGISIEDVKPEEVLFTIVQAALE